MTRMLKKFFVLLLALACLLSASAFAQSVAVSGTNAAEEMISEALCAENITVSLPEDGGWFFSDDGESMRATGAARFSVTLTAAAGEALGFENIYGFSRFFKNYCGRSPSEYRKDKVSESPHIDDAN